MSRSTRLRSADYETLLDLVGQLAELPADALVRRRHALAALVAAFDARSGIFCHTARFDDQPRLLDHVTVGLDDAPQDQLRDYFAGRLPLDPCATVIESLAPADDNATRLRRQLVPDDAWYRCDHYNGLRAACHLDDGVYARVVSPDRNTFGISIMRDRADRALTDRHRQMLHVFNAHACRLYCLDQPLDASPLSRLAPRLRPVAERFLHGDSVKQAARHLGLSRHTVAEYAKQIYRTYNVSSRAELLVALMRRQTHAA